MPKPAVNLAFPDSAGGLEPPASLGWARRAGSLKVTLALLAVLLPAVVLAYNAAEWRSWPIALPLGGLALNLVAALLTNPSFRRQTPLVVFHLSLVALLLLIAAGRLSYLTGELELTDGAMFEGELTRSHRGPFHAGALDAVRFENLGFVIDYDPGLNRGPTRNHVRWLDDGRWRDAVIGDQTALVTQGYRFYTSFNKGFAPTFAFTASDGTRSVGSVHLPSYPIHELEQALEWSLPGTQRSLWILLDFDEAILDPENPSVFRLPKDYRIVVRDGDRREVLTPGASVSFPEGTLELVGLRGWMGYNVFYDWTLPWLAATGALSALSLGWHFLAKFQRKPWDS